MTPWDCQRLPPIWPLLKAMRLEFPERKERNAVVERYSDDRVWLKTSQNKTSDASGLWPYPISIQDLGSSY